MSSRPVADRPAEGDLDVDLDVRRVDAGGIVDGVGVAAPAIEAIGDARELGHAEVGALADDADAELVGRHPDRIVGPVADPLVALARGANEGADAAEEEEVGPRLEDGAEHLVRRRPLAGRARGARGSRG